MADMHNDQSRATDEVASADVPLDEETMTESGGAKVLKSAAHSGPYIFTTL